ncbi:MAG TPA: RecX family transcriptional regulator [Stellaceae bacterium]|nr:RecX family transcriptional regulator [Stellaceae bacterium]
MNDPDPSSTPREPTRPRSARAPRVVTEAYLHKAALAYLERFQSSVAGVRRVLMRRVRRSVEAHGTDLAEATGWVEALLLRYCRAGLLDDRVYAAAQIASQHRRGASSRAIGARLAGKGIDRATAAEVLDQAAELRPGGDLAAAAALARRRRLGPYRDRTRRDDLYPKDLATLARAGFDRATADRVLRAADTEALDALVAEAAEV